MHGRRRPGETMGITVTAALCCRGVDDVRSPHLPPRQQVLDEAAAADFGGLELGPRGHVPFDAERGVTCPISRGAIDYPAVRDALRRGGCAGFVTVEQERDPRDAGGGLAGVTASRDDLRGIGL